MPHLEIRRNAKATRILVPTQEPGNDDAEEQGGHAFRVLEAYVKSLEQEVTGRTEKNSFVTSVSSCSNGRRVPALPQPLVEMTVIDSKQGTAFTLVNWTREPVGNLQFSVPISTANSKVSSASGRGVRVEEIEGARVYTLDLDVADALILR